MNDDLKIRVSIFCRTCNSFLKGEWDSVEPFAHLKCPKCGYECTLHLGGGE